MASQAWRKVDDLEQWNRRSSVRVINLPDPDEHEGHIQCLHRVMWFFTTILGLGSFDPDQIDICHRVGRFSESRNRLVIVKFLRRTTKLYLMANKRRSRQGAPYVVEDLTKRRLHLLQKARSFSGIKQAWSSEGRILARLWNERVVAINEDTDWNRLGSRATPQTDLGEQRYRRMPEAQQPRHHNEPIPNRPQLRPYFGKDIDTRHGRVQSRNPRSQRSSTGVPENASSRRSYSLDRAVAEVTSSSRPSRERHWSKPLPERQSSEVQLGTALSDTMEEQRGANAAPAKGDALEPMETTTVPALHEAEEELSRRQPCGSGHLEERHPKEACEPVPSPGESTSATRDTNPACDNHK